MTEVIALPRRRAAFVFIFLTVVLDVLALGIIIPVLPKLTIDLLGGNEVSAAKMTALFGVSWALMQLVSMPVLGALSDRFGRRPVIIQSQFGLGLDYIMLALAPTIWWLFAGRLINGITSASMSTAYAYIADVTPPEQRAARFGLLGAAFGIGFVLGPTLGGILGDIDLRLPFWVAAALSLANAAYGFFILPESLAKEKRSPFKLKTANPFGAVRFLASKSRLAGLALIAFLSNFAHYVFPSAYALYAYSRFGWDERVMGLTLAAVGVGSMIVQGVLIRPAVKLLGERNCLLSGITCGALGFAIYGLASTESVFWLGIPFASLWGLAGPANQSFMSARVAETEQGQLQGSLGSLNSLGGLVAPGIFPLVLAASIAPGVDTALVGAPFLIASLCLVAAGAVAVFATQGLPLPSQLESKA